MVLVSVEFNCGRVDDSRVQGFGFKPALILEPGTCLAGRRVWDLELNSVKYQFQVQPGNGRNELLVEGCVRRQGFRAGYRSPCYNQCASPGF